LDRRGGGNSDQTRKMRVCSVSSLLHRHQLRLDLMATDQMGQELADQIERIVSTTGVTETTPKPRRLGE
jgi:hypothetical protein